MLKLFVILKWVRFVTCVIKRVQSLWRPPESCCRDERWSLCPWNTPNAPKLNCGLQTYNSTLITEAGAALFVCIYLCVHVCSAGAPQMFLAEKSKMKLFHACSFKAALLLLVCWLQKSCVGHSLPWFILSSRSFFLLFAALFINSFLPSWKWKVSLFYNRCWFIPGTGPVEWLHCCNGPSGQR